ncbi:glycosyltransferase family 4 protein [Geobacter sp. AOG1]|uniref:glycosyltransferase family 4 protein n=1 Tax=Geobacter sp. AOG1 TaxID=1566346 RepID=UPI001CC41C37|nr:glycosyltransferase family 4 protein [Geobacter sp. AOG1]
MASVSGFDPLFSALENSVPGRIQNYYVPHYARNGKQIHVWQRFWQLVKSPRRVQYQEMANSPFVECRHEIIAAEVLSCAERNPDALVLLSAGENQFGYNFANASDSIRRRTLLCLHQPPSWLRLHWRDFSTLNGLGAIICFSQEQIKFISDICTTPTILIRHGVCHDFFRPTDSSSANTPPRLIFVGQWLRDFDTLAAAMELVWSEQPETRLDCVVIREVRNHPALLKLARDARVHWHADISPETLRKLYQQADFLFLPLIDSAANNAIVESLASGLPIITSRVGGVVDYVPEATGELCTPGDASSHAKTVLRWIQNREHIQDSAVIAREFAEYDLDWARIANNLIFELHQLAYL